MRTTLGGLLLLSGLLACGGRDDEGDERMSPGQNCQACHGFALAGTVYASATADSGAGLQGVTVEITDANQAVQTFTSNAAGNFFTRAALALPLQKAAVIRNGQRAEMSGPPAGDCNRCHTLPPTGAAVGRIHVP
ncbi:MAG: hypothetical protein HGB30_14590 [Holophagaceae bacterium]|nr:hypothetical protein [Holophagaceae bacterium]